MKPFNLEAFRSGDIALTRDGREARFVAECSEEEFPRVFEMYRLVYTAACGVYTSTRSGYRYDNLPGKEDLVSMKPKEVTLFAIVHATWDGDVLYQTLYNSKEDAIKGWQKNAASDRVPLIATVTYSR